MSIKKYGHKKIGQGWWGESHPHGLCAKGIKLGRRKTDYIHSGWTSQAGENKIISYAKSPYTHKDGSINIIKQDSDDGKYYLVTKFPNGTELWSRHGYKKIGDAEKRRDDVFEESIYYNLEGEEGNANGRYVYRLPDKGSITVYAKDKLEAVQKVIGKISSENIDYYTPTYVASDLPLIAGDAVGTAGASAVGIIPLAVAVGGGYLVAKGIKKSLSKHKHKHDKKKVHYARDWKEDKKKQCIVEWGFSEEEADRYIRQNYTSDGKLKVTMGGRKLLIKEFPDDLKKSDYAKVTLDTKDWKGLSDGKPDFLFDKRELKKGMKVEMEHTDNPEIAKAISKDHLTEFRGLHYYDALDRMEAKLKHKMR